MAFSIQDFARAFVEAPRPTKEDIVSCACEECEKIRSDFEPYISSNLPGRTIEYHYDSLPLLTPAALRYFLPAYVAYTVKNPDSDVSEWILYHLCPDKPDDEYWQDRITKFSNMEIQQIISYLESRLPGEDFFDQEITSGIALWTSFTDAA